MMWGRGRSHGGEKKMCNPKEEKDQKYNSSQMCSLYIVLSSLHLQKLSGSPSHSQRNRAPPQRSKYIRVLWALMHSSPFPAKMKATHMIRNSFHNENNCQDDFLGWNYRPSMTTQREKIAAAVTAGPNVILPVPIEGSINTRAGNNFPVDTHPSCQQIANLSSEAAAEGRVPFATCTIYHSWSKRKWHAEKNEAAEEDIKVGSCKEEVQEVQNVCTVSKCLIGKRCEIQALWRLSRSVEMNKNHCVTFVHEFFFLLSWIHKLFNVHANETKADVHFLKMLDIQTFVPLHPKSMTRNSRVSYS